VKVGLFDSGLGGLSILREVLLRAPNLDIHYHADQARLPWGPRPADELRAYCRRITAQLALAGCERIVLACNTASAVALQDLRASFPELQFVGMEPAIKPAARLTRTGTVGLLATPATLAGELLAQTRARHAPHIAIVSDPCCGLAEAIEAGEPSRIETLLQNIITPMTAARADVLVLGCTHYPFASETIARIAGPAVAIVDPAPAVASQLLRLIPHPAAGSGTRVFTTSGDPELFNARAGVLLGKAPPTTHVDWASGAMCAPTTGR